MSGFVHETFNSPICPPCSDGAQVPGAKCSMSQIVAHGAYSVGTDCIPVVSALNGERIIRSTVGILKHKPRSNHRRRPARCRVMFHCRHLTSVPESHAQDLYRSRARAIEAHVVGSRTNHFHGLAYSLRGKCSRHTIVTIEATAESSTNQVSAQHYLVFRAAQRFGH